MNVTTMSKKQMEQIMWEIDEDMDGCVSWDEFQLTFCRNVDTTRLVVVGMLFIRLFMLLFTHKFDPLLTNVLPYNLIYVHTD